MKKLSVFVGFALAACSGADAPTKAAVGDINASIDTVQVNGALRLEVHDSPAMQATQPFETPATITGGSGIITVSKSQLGSLCRYALKGSADARSGKIGLHVAFAERLTTCTAEVRVLKYDASITTAPGAYDVAVIHELNGAVDTIARQTVTVR